MFRMFEILIDGRDTMTLPMGVYIVQIAAAFAIGAIGGILVSRPIHRD